MEMDGWEDKLGALLSDAGAMEQIRQLADTLAGNAAGPGAEAPREPMPPGPGDGALGALLGRVMGAYAAPSEAGRLVAALKPFLQPERSARLERALRVARLVQAARTVLPELLPGSGKQGG